MGEMVTNWLAVSAQDWKFWEFKPLVMSLKTILKSFTHLASQMCKKECLIARERAEGVVRVTCWRMAQRPILSSEGRESFISFHFSPKYYSFQFHPAFFVFYRSTGVCSAWCPYPPFWYRFLSGFEVTQSMKISRRRRTRAEYDRTC